MICRCYKSKDGQAQWSKIDGELDTAEICGRLYTSYELTRAARQLINKIEQNGGAIEITQAESEICAACQSCRN